MGIISSIGWTDATINFWHGCTKVSEGCKYCYMFRNKERYGQEPTTVLKRKKRDILNDLKKITPGKKIFTCSWSDFFIEEADEWRAEAWQIIKDHPQFQWQILTKRPERVLSCLPADWGNGYDNVWLGVSVENQKRAVERIPLLMRIPAKIRFLSCEPLLEAIDITQRAVNYSVPTKYHGNIGIEWTDPGDGFIGIDWVVIGGESGNDEGKYKYRPCQIAWIEDLLFQCYLYAVPAFVKQLGTHISKQFKEIKARHGDVASEWPKGLQIQEFPKFTPYKIDVMILDLTNIKAHLAACSNNMDMHSQLSLDLCSELEDVIEGIEPEHEYTFTDLRETLGSYKYYIGNVLEIIDTVRKANDVLWLEALDGYLEHIINTQLADFKK